MNLTLNGIAAMRDKASRMVAGSGLRRTLDQDNVLVYSAATEGHAYADRCSMHRQSDF